MKLKSILKHFYKSSIILLCLSVMISGCATATKPSDIPAQNFASESYQDYDCKQLKMEQSKWDSKYTAAYKDQEKRYKSDRGFYISAIVLGVFLSPIWGFLGFGIEGDSALTYDEISQSQSEIQAIKFALQNKNC